VIHPEAKHLQILTWTSNATTTFPLQFKTTSLGSHSRYGSVYEKLPKFHSRYFITWWFFFYWIKFFIYRMIKSFFLWSLNPGRWWTLIVHRVKVHQHLLPHFTCSTIHIESSFAWSICEGNSDLTMNQSMWISALLPCHSLDGEILIKIFKKCVRIFLAINYTTLCSK